MTRPVNGRAWAGSLTRCPMTHAPARERAGYAHEGRLRGLPEPAQAGLALALARPFTGWGTSRSHDRPATR